LEYLDWRSFQWLESLYWRPFRVIWNIYTGGLPVQMEYLYWRSSSAIWDIYTGDRPVPFGIFILEGFQFVASRWFVGIVGAAVVLPCDQESDL
jgi:hypothetical protein